MIRGFLTKSCSILMIGVLASSLMGCSTTDKKTSANPESTKISAVYKRPAEVKTAKEAMDLLVAGNQRFNTDAFAVKNEGDVRRDELVKGQKPFAIIVSCSDSRVPPELVFDQALGDLFVVRVAGNVVDSIAIGSVEYAVEHLQSPLIVVLGHEKCGAVKATTEGGEAPGSIGSIVEKIKPSVEKAKAKGVTGDELVEKSVNINVEAVTKELEKSPLVKHAIESGKLQVVGAKYHLDGGTVEWFNQIK
jgi:carbonic anhydrase